jgi:hypothetical protein
MSRTSISSTQEEPRVGLPRWQETDIREKVSDAIIATRDTVAQVVDKMWASDPPTSRFENWNLRDLLCHINAWAEYCGGRLRASEAGTTKVSSIDVAAFNRAVYQSNRRTPLSVALSDHTRTFDALAAAVRAIPDRLIARAELPTGFDLPLWRDVLVDGFAHPTQHLMFHCLKRGHLPLFFSLERRCRLRFQWFAPENRSAALCFRDYFPSDADCALFFENLRPDIRNEAQRDVWERTLLANLREGSA